MKKEDLDFYLICPRCNRQDHLSWGEFNKHVLSIKPVELPWREEEWREGEYHCPYGCGVNMFLFAVGTYEEVNKKSDELYLKYPITEK